jgi:hypothetical protein
VAARVGAKVIDESCERARCDKKEGPEPDEHHTADETPDRAEERLTDRRTLMAVDRFECDQCQKGPKQHRQGLGGQNSREECHENEDSAQNAAPLPE